MTDLKNIPLNKLALWKGNVRKTGATEALEELIASIAAHGLLQSLVVREAPAKGKTKGKYHVVAGQRRFMALNALAERGAITADHPIPCQIISGKAQAQEISLAENTVRLPMHPADQFEAFQALHENGAPVPDIAARFGVAESTVEKLLKLARVSPVILRSYRDGDLNLAQVQAFASTDDQAAQERVFHDINPYHADPEDIRESLRTDTEIPATDKRVKYAGLEAYERAGGKTRRDLFTEGDDGIFILNVELLNSLASLKLSKSAEEIRAEGWAWVEIDPDLPWETRHKCQRIFEEPAPLSPELQTEYDGLEKELNALYESADEADEETLSAKIEEIESRIADLDDRETSFRPEEIAIAGCFITIDHDGKLDILRGYVKPEDKARLTALHKAQEANDPEAIEQAINTPPEPQQKGMAASLTEFLTEHRSIALQATLAANPDIGLAAAVHAIADGIFYRSGQAGSCLSSFASRKYHRLAKDSTANDELDREESLWRDRIPGDEQQFWQWCLTQDRDTLVALLTHCVALSIDATQRKQDKPDCARLQHADMLANALKLDMSLYFRPDAGNYFSRISKDMILADLREITGKDASPAMLKMKKSELAKHAARAVAETRWLPAILRTNAVQD